MQNSPDLLDFETKNKIIQRLIDRLKLLYFDPEKAQQICENLHRRFDTGEYSDIQECDLFALAVTMNLQEINHDEHLWLKWHPEILPEDDAPLRLNPEWQAERLHEAQLDNYGFYRVERLPGNIGYLDIRIFQRAAWGRESALSAMRLLSFSSALILDLRQCTGGHLDMIALILSHLFGEAPIHLTSVYWRDEDKTEEFWTQPALPNRRFEREPVYVLTSRKTFSGGEAFASILQTRKRAVVMGEKTDGGAHPGASYRLHPHFEVFIPIGRVVDPLTHNDLEGVGVTPDIQIPQEHAFLAAYHFALKDVIAHFENSALNSELLLAGEAKRVFADQSSQSAFCPRCGYPNPPAKELCKNCDTSLSRHN